MKIKTAITVYAACGVVFALCLVPALTGRFQAAELAVFRALCPAGGSFIDGIIVDRFHLLCTSGHDGPKRYRSSWEVPAFSLWGAGGDFWNCFSVSRMEGTERAFSG